MRATIGLVVFALCCAIGCAGGAGSGAKRRPFVDVPVPPNTVAARLEPRSGEALAKAQLSLPQVLQTLPSPDYLIAAPTDADQSPPVAEPPLAAQQAYVTGRQAWLSGNRPRAIRRLQTAHDLAPQSAAISRLLGRIQSQYNPARAPMYLKQAVRLDPQDAASLLLLGRHQIQQNTMDDAIVTFAHALSRPKRRHDVAPSVWPLLQFHLANALDQSGYDAAALLAYEQHLDAPRHVVRSVRFARDLAYLHRRRSTTHMRMGDAHHRLNQPGNALISYHRSAELGIADPRPLVRRLTYTYLRLGRRNLAQDIVLHQLRQSEADAESVKLIEYLVANGIDRHSLTGQLRQVYESSNGSGEMVISIAALLPDEQGKQLLRQHVAARPADSAVFTALIERLVADSDQGAAAEPLVEAITITAATITAKPAASDRYVTLMMDAGVEPPQWLAAHDLLAPTRRGEPAMRYVRGRILRRAGRTQEAIDQFDQVVAALPQFEQARLALVRLLVDHGQYQRAEQVMQPLAESDDTDVIVLHARVLVQSRGPVQAIELIERRLAQSPQSIALVLEKSRLQLLGQDADGAERTLLKSINVHPKELQLYDALFDLYEFHSRAPNIRRYASLRKTVLQTMPNSWLARLIRAEDVVVAGDRNLLADLEPVLTRLLQQRPRHYRALNLYLDLLWRTGKQQQANDLIDGRVADEPKDLNLLNVALRHYSEVRADDKQRFNQTMVMLLLTMPDSEGRALDVSFYYLLLDNPSRAVAIVTPYLQGKPKRPASLVNRLRQAMAELDAFEQGEQMIGDMIEKFPDHRADLMLQLSMHYQGFDRHDLAEQVLADVVEQYPDHAGANNALGYTWADRGVNLEQAEKLIRHALKSEPGSAAIRDSLGWVHYKQGRFIDAITELTNATKEKYGDDDPVIRDHLGDALYRLDRPKEARQQWRDALKDFDPEKARFNMDQKGLDKRIGAKLEALRENRPPPTGEVPVQDDRPPQPST